MTGAVCGVLHGFEYPETRAIRGGELAARRQFRQQKQALYRHIFILIVANFYRYCRIMHANTWQHINPNLCVL